jgi:ribokinase
MKKYCLVYGCCVFDKAFYQKDNSNKISFGGKGGNQAVALSRAGVKTVILSMFSSNKEELKNTKLHLKNLKKNKIVTKYLGFNSEKANDVTFVIVDKNGNNSFQEKISISQDVRVEYIKQNADVIKNASIVLLQMKMPVETTRELVRICKENGVKTILTPCRIQKTRDNMDIVDNVDFITCNEDEVTGIFSNSKKLTKVELENILKKYPNKLIVTLGKKGVKYFDGKKVITEKAIHVENVEDTTGAGDTFAGNFAEAIFNGDGLRTAIRKGICASTLKVQVAGTQNGMPWKKERNKLFQEIYGKEKE